MSLIEAFERSHLLQFARYEQIPLPKRTWRTPGGRWWTPQEALNGWQSRISDHWSWVTLHYWIVKDEVDVSHVELPTGLQRHSPEDPAWAFIDRTFGPGVREPWTHPLGRADLFCPSPNPDRSGLTVEFGTCTPAKFVINLGWTSERPWMIVPYDEPFAFVFEAKRQLVQVKRDVPAGRSISVPVRVTPPVKTKPPRERTAKPRYSMETFREVLRRRK